MITLERFFSGSFHYPVNSQDCLQNNVFYSFFLDHRNASITTSLSSLFHTTQPKNFSHKNRTSSRIPILLPFLVFTLSRKKSLPKNQAAVENHTSFCMHTLEKRSVHGHFTGFVLSPPREHVKTFHRLLQNLLLGHNQKHWIQQSRCQNDHLRFTHVNVMN